MSQTLSKRFRSLHDKFLRCREHPDVGVNLVRINALAAKAVDDAIAENLLAINFGERLSPPETDLQWSNIWCLAVAALHKAYPSRLPSRIAEFRPPSKMTENLNLAHWSAGSDKLHWSAGRPPRTESHNWRQCAEDFALVCDLIADLIDECEGTPKGTQEIDPDINDGLELVCEKLTPQQIGIVRFLWDKKYATNWDTLKSNHELWRGRDDAQNDNTIHVALKRTQSSLNAISDKVSLTISKSQRTVKLERF